MVDYHSNLVSALKTVLPTHYEMTLTSNTQVPCISYMEMNNYVIADSENIGYSRISYQVKVWATTIAEIQRYSLEVDKALRAIGFTRVSSGELYDRNSSMIQKIMTYEAMSLEKY